MAPGSTSQNTRECWLVSNLYFLPQALNVFWIITSSVFFITFIYFVHVCAWAHRPQRMCGGTEDNVQDLDLSFHHVGFELRLLCSVANTFTH